MEKLHVLLACVFGLCVSSVHQVITPAVYEVRGDFLVPTESPVLIIEAQTSNLPLEPQNSPTSEISHEKAQDKMILGILSVAQDLSDAFGSRPPYDGTKYKKGQALSKADAIYVSPYLIACESRNQSVKIIDTNDLYSYGIGQFQSSTWNRFSEESGIMGDPMEKEDAVEMMVWALEHGKLCHWSCARIIGVL